MRAGQLTGLGSLVKVLTAPVLRDAYGVGVFKTYVLFRPDVQKAVLVMALTVELLHARNR